MGPAIEPSRRFLFRSIKQKPLPFRPPWSIAEKSFTDLCERCDLCIDSCKTGLLIRGSGGFPEADFTRGGCNFCEDCLNACPKQLLQKTGKKAWSLLPMINSSCLAKNKVHCRSCSEACDFDAVHFQLIPGNAARPAIDHSACTACAECISTCPVSAITMTPAEEAANAAAR